MAQKRFLRLVKEPAEKEGRPKTDLIFYKTDFAELYLLYGRTLYRA